MTTMKLAAALAKVQANLPKLERDRTVEVTQKNGGTYSYSYVTLANLSDSILPLLAEHGLSFVALPGAGSDGKMCVRYQLLHESGEALAGEFPISGEGGIQMIGGRITYARRYCLAAIVGVAADEDDEARLAEGDGPRTAQRAGTQPRQRTAAPRPEADGEPDGRTAQRAAHRPRGGRPPLPGEEPDGKVGQDQHRHMHALWRDLGAGGDEHRDFRLRKTAEFLGINQLDSSADLTRAQAEVVIAKLKERKAAKQAPAEGGVQ
jgi:hypothetical protein